MIIKWRRTASIKIAVKRLVPRSKTRVGAVACLNLQHWCYEAWKLNVSLCLCISLSALPFENWKMGNVRCRMVSWGNPPKPGLLFMRSLGSLASIQRMNGRMRTPHVRTGLLPCRLHLLEGSQVRGQEWSNQIESWSFQNGPHNSTMEIKWPLVSGIPGYSLRNLKTGVRGYGFDWGPVALAVNCGDQKGEEGRRTFTCSTQYAEGQSCMYLSSFRENFEVFILGTINPCLGHIL